MQINAEALKVEQYGFIGEIIFSNPRKYNALDQQAWMAVPGAVDALIAGGARVIIISGEGANFCAGADISEFDTVRKNAETALDYENANAEAFAAIRKASVPVLAKIRGYCLGGGFGLAAAVDIRLAVTGATFAVPAAKLGLGYPVEAMADIVNAIGEQNAKRMLFTAERFSARQMQTMGFLAEVFHADMLDDHTNELAKAIADLAPLTHRSTKASIAAALGGDVEEAQRLGSERSQARTMLKDEPRLGKSASQCFAETSILKLKSFDQTDKWQTASMLLPSGSRTNAP